MGQAEIIECLEKHDKPISRKQIAEEIDYDVVKVSHLIKKLLNKNEIKCIELNRIQAGKMLGLDRPFRRTRFYYV
jgi:DNA-binding MarR family transcriptional regulator